MHNGKNAMGKKYDCMGQFEIAACDVISLSHVGVYLIIICWSCSPHAMI